MNRTTRLDAFLLALLLFLVAAATVTQPAQASTANRQAATPVPTAAGTVTPTPRATATSAATPPVDVSVALIRLGDLPPGFRPASEEELKTLNAIGDPSEAFRQHLVHYCSADGQTILSHTLTYPLEPTTETFRVLSSILLARVAGTGKASEFWAGGSNVTESADLPGMDNLGTLAAGATFVTNPAPSRFNRHDGVLMLREYALSNILLSYPEGKPPAVTVQQLAQLVDQRLAAALGITPKPVVSAQPPPEWPLLVDADFDTNAHQWGTGDSRSEFGTLAKSIQDGKYRWDATATKGVIWRSSPSARSVSNFYVTADAQRTSGPKSALYGIAFNFDGANYGVFEIRDDQFFYVGVRYQDKWKTLIESTRAPAIRPGEANQLTVRGDGPNFAFFVNGQLVGQAVNNDLVAGRPGLVVELNPGESAVCEFDNFHLHALPTALRLAGGEPLSLDPALANDSGSATYLVEIFSGLVTLDRNLAVAPDLAERWEVNENGTVYTFHLRANAKFQDGRTVTAQDVQYSLERAADPGLKSTAASTYLGDIVGVNDKLSGKAWTIRGVRVIDDRTLQITIDAPKSYFLAKLAHNTAFVVDKNNVERDGAAWTTKPNGTGPYKLKEYVPKERLILEGNENYYLTPRPQIQQVQFALTTGGTSYLTQYTNGDLDVISVGGTTADGILDASHALRKEATVVSRLSVSYIVLNTRRPPFDDPKVREAFALAMDRQKIAAEYYGKVRRLSKSILPPTMPGYNEALPDIAYSPDRARQMLGESKYGGHLPPIVWGVSDTNKAVPAMVEMLKANLGVEIRIEQTDWATLSAVATKSDNPYNLFIYGWEADYPDPENYIAVLFQSTSAYNVSGYADPEVDQWIAQAVAEPDSKRRVLLYQQAERKILQDWAVIPFLQDQTVWLVKPYLQDLSFPGIQLPRLRFAAFVGGTNATTSK